MPNKACVETLLRLSVQRILDHLIVCDYFRMQSLEKCPIPSSFSSRVIDNYHSLKKSEILAESNERRRDSDSNLFHRLRELNKIRKN